MAGVHVAAQLRKNSKCYLEIANLGLGEGAVPSGLQNITWEIPWPQVLEG